MRRLALFSGCALLLISCTPQETLPSDQVLEKTSQVMHDLESVRFDMNATVQGTTPFAKQTDVEMTAKGWLHRELKQLQSAVSLKGTADEMPLELTADVIVAGENETYMNLKGLTSSDPKSPLRSPFFNLITNQWWKLPGNGGNAPVADVTPDPRLLDLQSKAVVVTKDYGVSTAGDRPSYRYDTTIDRQKLLAYMEEIARERKEPFDATQWNELLETTDLNGTVWIDAESFRINRMLWTVASKQKTWTSTFDITFTDHDNAPTVAPPAGAKDLPSLPSLIPSVVPQLGEDTPAGMTDEMQQDLLNSLLDTE